MGSLYKYDFSVVMAVYNVEEYLREAVDSLVKQTIGFSRIQLIMVDDGSTDGSGKICDEYGIKYPENVMVLHKKNGGQASARNMGLQHVEGKYVNFLDSDDTISADTFRKVKAFMDTNSNVLISCIPIHYFGNLSGEHHLNNKFEAGTRIIDLTIEENAKYILLSSSASFYKAEAVRNMFFDTEIYTAEDAKENLKILISTPYIGVISDAKYNYRKYGNSTLDKSKYKKAWYLSYLEHFAEWALDTAEQKNGFIPKFVQYTVMYDLQWKLLQSHIPEGVLTEKESVRYKELLFHLACRIDPDVIMSQNSLGIDRKLYLLDKKGLICDKNTKNVNGIMHYHDALSQLNTMINIIDVDSEHIMIEGFQVYPNWSLSSPAISIAINHEKQIRGEKIDYSETVYSADIPVARRYYFRTQIPLQYAKKAGKIELSFCSYYKNIRIEQKRIHTGRYSPIARNLEKSWFMKKGFLFRPTEAGILIKWVGKHSLITAVGCETQFMLSIAKINATGARKALFCRGLYHILKPIVSKNIWLVTDKADRADDNGEAFFKYLLSLGKKAGCKPVFAIRRQSPDYKRLRKLGKVIPYMSWRHKLTHLLAEHTVSAYSHDEISSPFRDYSQYYGDLLQRNKVVFLQHGITKDDVSRGLNRYHKNFALFVTSTQREWESIVHGNYGYYPEQVILTGLPRYDLLYDDRKNYITVMPTWYRSLCGRFIAEESRWELLPGFEESEYYNFYTRLLSNERLLAAADQNDYKIRFLLHPVFLPYVDRFFVDSRVQVLHSDVSYRKVFAESALITTDYSSVAFDFAYLKKPVIYTQFEKNHYEEGYFDYERDGFGEVEHTVEDTVDRLIEYMKNGCVLKEMYRDRIDSFFEYHDKRNCERVYQAIRKLDRLG